MEKSTSGSSVAKHPMVSSVDIIQYSQIQHDEPTALTVCQVANYLRLLLSHPAPSYMAFLMEVYGIQFQSDNIQFLGVLLM